jgi:copper chaperone NosL
MGNRKSLSLIVLAATVFLLAGGYAIGQTDVEKHKSCNYCGMNRGQFAQSRMLITYSDGSEVALCSLHCAAVDLAVSLDKTPKTIQVADFATKNLIDAEQAFWVIGGNKPGVMSKRAKWAFADKAGAEEFVKVNGGRLASFEEAAKAAYEDMYADTKMIREKRKMMKMKMSMEKGHSH